LGHPIASVEVDADNLTELVRRLSCTGHRGALACIVDKDVDAPEVLDGRPDDAPVTTATLSSTRKRSNTEFGMLLSS
jgi:hypothetical protein